MLLASATDVITSSGLLGFILGGGLLTAIIGGYRFVVNFRMTERGMARDRVSQAVSEQRAERSNRLRAEREAALWQSRCGDLEYALRQAGGVVPAISAELHVLAFSSNTEAAILESESLDRPHRHQHPATNNATLGELDQRLRQIARDETDQS